MNKADYKNNRKFGDECLPQVKAIMGQFLYRDDLTFEDQKHNTDLMVMRTGDERSGVRIRRYNAYKNKLWRNQYTIRYRLKSGYPTEFGKILYCHWGSYFFYGFASPDGKLVIKWIIGDFDAFRVYVGEKMAQDEEKFIREHFQPNAGDDDSDFLVFNNDEIPGFVVMDSEHFPGWANPKSRYKYWDINDVPKQFKYLCEVTI